VKRFAAAANLYKVLKRLHRCVDCGAKVRRGPKGWINACAKCAKIHVAATLRRFAKRRKAGLCAKCNRKMCAKSTWFCARHLRMNREARHRRAALRAA